MGRVVVKRPVAVTLYAFYLEIVRGRIRRDEMIGVGGRHLIKTKKNNQNSLFFFCFNEGNKYQILSLAMFGIPENYIQNYVLSRYKIAHNEYGGNQR